jgi:uncharacterized protein (TIGR00369 family)
LLITVDSLQIIDHREARQTPGFFLAPIDKHDRIPYESPMREIVKYDQCFVCGDENPGGLRAKFYWDGESARAEVVAAETFEGYKGIYHGGVISALLDEVMIKAILARDIFAVTAEMTVRYYLPVRTGQRLRFVGRVTGAKGRVYFAEGEVTGPDGTKFASATGKYIEARPELKDQLMESIED